MVAVTPASSVETVLGVPELLESILLLLDITTLLLTANRVSKSWHNIIYSSPALRRVLYLDPITPLTDAHQGKASPSEPILNPLFIKFFAPCFFDFGYDLAYFRRANSFFSMPWVIRPRRECRLENGSVDALPLYPRMDPEDPSDNANRRRFTRKGASWRRMLVSQPPPRQLGCLWNDDQVDTALALFYESKIGAADGLGLRMGQLYDLVQFHASHHARRSLWYRVLWGQLREPTFCDFGEEAGKRLLQETGVSVEFTEIDDYWQDHHPDPTDPTTFDAVFLCEDAAPADLQKELVATIEWIVGSGRFGWAPWGGIY